MQLLRRFSSFREGDKKPNNKTIAVARAVRRRSSFVATGQMRRLTNFFGSSSAEEDVKQQQKQQQQTLAVATTTTATITTGTTETAAAVATTTAPTTQVYSSQQTAQVGLRVPLTPPKENLPTLPESPVSVNGRQNAPGLSISLPSPAPIKNTHDTGGSLTPPMSETNQSHGGLSPNLQSLPLSPHPISPIAPPGGGNRNISGASYASFATTTSSRPSSSHMNFPIAPSPAPSEVARATLRKKRRGGGGFFGKRKKDDVDSPTAWRLTKASSEHLEGYDYAPLAKGEPV